MRIQTKTTSKCQQPAVCLLLAICLPAAVFSQSTADAFTWQAEIKERGIPVVGLSDLRFRLYSSQQGGDELASLKRDDVHITAGTFSVQLSFDGRPVSGRWLEIAIRHGSDSGEYVVLSPRHYLTQTPHAILMQAEAWSLIGLAIGPEPRQESSVRAVSAKLPEEDRAATEASKQAAAGPGRPGFLAKFDAGGNAFANSAIFDSRGLTGVGTTAPNHLLHLRSPGTPWGETSSQLKVEGTATRAGLLLTHSGNGGAVGYANLGSGAQANTFYVTTGSGSIGSLVMDNLGNVGVGTRQPRSRLHLQGDGIDNDGSNSVLRLSNGAQTLLLDGNEIDALADGLFLNHNTDQRVVLATGGGRVGIGTAQPAAKLEVVGTTRTSVLEITGGSDLAEPFEISGAVRPGMLVAIDPENPGRLILSSSAYDRTVAGIVSGANGIHTGLTLSQDRTVADGSYPVALTGRVYCWADASSTPIEPGDLLTSSDVPGYAMKAANPHRAYGAIVGKALTRLAEGRGLALVLVSLQ